MTATYILPPPLIYRVECGDCAVKGDHYTRGATSVQHGDNLQEMVHTLLVHYIDHHIGTLEEQTRGVGNSYAGVLPPGEKKVGTPRTPLITTYVPRSMGAEVVR